MTKQRTGIIFCRRNAGASPKEVAKALEQMGAAPEPVVMTSIPCGNGDHENCGGDGCKCGCHDAV